MPRELKVLPVFHTPLVVTTLPHVDNKVLVDIVYHFSAVYYPKVPALESPEGSIVFFNPRETFAGGQPVQLPPQEGMMVLFPSWLKHSVVPMQRARDDRISISLNAVIGPLRNADNYPPHRAKKRAPGDSSPPEFDPASPEQRAYPADA